MEKSAFKLSRYLVQSEPIVDGLTGKLSRVIFGTRTASMLVTSEQLWQSLTEAQFTDLPDTVFNKLAQYEILVPANENELSAVSKTAALAIATNSELYQVIQPTAFCQLGCDYCGQEHNQRQLNTVDQGRLIQRLEKKLSSGKFRQLRVCWFGAEPLAAIGVMRKLSPTLVQLAEQSKCSYSAVIVTNGLTLSTKIADELINSHKIDQVEITLDGTAEFHDKRRATKKGDPTFQRILANLKGIARRKDVKIRVRCNVDSRNVEGVEALIDLLADEGLNDRISFYTAPVHSWGNDADEEALSPDDFARYEIDWFARMAVRGFNVQLLPTLRPIVCMALKPEAELIDAYGTLFNCTEVSYVPTYGSPNLYAIGSIGTPAKVVNNNRLTKFNDEVSEGKYQCSECPMLPVCGGGCPKQWQEGRVPCPSAKFNMMERLVLAYAIDRIKSTGSPF